MVLGPRQFETDKNGGAVLCAWGIYLGVQAATAACHLERRPVDDAIDEAIQAMDEFILTNSSLHPTRSALEDFKRRGGRGAFSPQSWELAADGLPQLCSQSKQDLEGFRQPNPDQIRTSVKQLLAVPREPVMNPCL